jgi:hypothetical protein
MIRKLFSGSKKKKTECDRSTHLRLAVEKGYITEDQACEFEGEIGTGDLDLDETQTDLMIDRGLLSNSQAEVIAFDVKKCDPAQALDDSFKKASSAMRTNMNTAEAVGTKTAGFFLSDVVAAKNKG